MLARLFRGAARRVARVAGPGVRRYGAAARKAARRGGRAGLDRPPVAARDAPPGQLRRAGRADPADEADRYDEPFEGTRCGRCRNCIESCPTGAIVAPRVVDAGRCIACHTIEREPASRIDLDGWIFRLRPLPELLPLQPQCADARPPSVRSPIRSRGDDARGVADARPREFEARFGRTPLTRSGLERIRSNIAAEADAPEPGTLLSRAAADPTVAAARRPPIFRSSLRPG